MILTNATLTWTLTLRRCKLQHWQVVALDTRHFCWDHHIWAIKYILLYDSKDAYWFGRDWLPSLLRTSWMGVRTEETSTVSHTLCSALQHIIIPWAMFGITDNRYSKSSTSNRSWCNIYHVTRPWVSPSCACTLFQKRTAYSRLAGHYPSWCTQPLFCGARSDCIKILSNALSCSRHFSTHLVFWTETASGLLCCCILTVTPFTQCIFCQRIHNAWDLEVRRSRLVLTSTWNVERYDLSTWITSYMLIPPGNVWGRIVLHLLITPSMRGIKLGVNVLDTWECPTRSCLEIYLPSAWGNLI